jgi:hypothetical protein
MNMDGLSVISRRMKLTADALMVATSLALMLMLAPNAHAAGGPSVPQAESARDVQAPAMPKPSQPAMQYLPDLSIALFVQQNPNFLVTVKNQGKGPSAATQLRITCTHSKPDQGWYGSVPALSGGQAVTIAIDVHSGTLVEGCHSVKVADGGAVVLVAIVDHKNGVPETNELNNRRTNIQDMP